MHKASILHSDYLFSSSAIKEKDVREPDLCSQTCNLKRSGSGAKRQNNSVNPLQDEMSADTQDAGNF